MVAFVVEDLFGTVIGLGLVLGLGAVLIVGLYWRRGHVAPTFAPMGFHEHLQELGTRLVRLAALWGYWILVMMFVRFERARVAGLVLPSPRLDLFANASSQIYLWIAHRVAPEGVTVVVLRATDAVSAQFSVAFLVAFVLSLPAMAYEVWAFFAPGLTLRERRAVSAAFPAAFLLFFLGAFFAVVYVTPLMLRTLYAFAGPLEAAPYISVGNLLGQVVTYCIVFGLAFQLPLVLVLLVRLRIASPRHYLRYWRHATIVIFVVAAFASDPTLVSQLIIGAMLLALYWGGVAASYLLRPAPRVG